VGEHRCFAGCFDLAEGLDRIVEPVEPELMKKIDGGMGGKVEW
jgi:hypothetical protein